MQNSLCGVGISPLDMSATIWPTVAVPDDGECEAVSGMIIGKGNGSAWRKSAIVPLSPPQIQQNLTRA
jgi:hypothetical protein